MNLLLYTSIFIFRFIINLYASEINHNFCNVDSATSDSIAQKLSKTASKYFWEEKYNEAAKNYFAAFNMFNDLGNSDKKYECLDWSGWCYIKFGDYHKAKEILNIAIVEIKKKILKIL